MMGDAARRKRAGTYPDQKRKPVRVITVKRGILGHVHFERDEYGHWRVLKPGQRITSWLTIQQLNAIADPEQPAAPTEPEEAPAGA